MDLNHIFGNPFKTYSVQEMKKEMNEARKFLVSARTEQEITFAMQYITKKPFFHGPDFWKKQEAVKDIELTKKIFSAFLKAFNKIPGKEMDGLEYEAQLTVLPGSDIFYLLGKPTKSKLDPVGIFYFKNDKTGLITISNTKK